MNSQNRSVAFSEINPGERFFYEDSQWEKRQDSLGADLVDRHGCISFIGGRRHIRSFNDTDVVSVAV